MRIRLHRLEIAAIVLASAMLTPATPVSASGGDEPVPQVLSDSGDGDTSRLIDQGGVEVFAVQDGHDLDHYTFRSLSPIDFAINVDRDYGPVDAIGHPAPGSALFGRHARLTLRAFDVDETYPGSDVEPEVDRVRVNGVEIEGMLTGATDQWSITTFDVPASVLLLPTVANPEGRNEFEVLIDMANVGGDVWAVEVDWAELRPITDGGARPLALLHGIQSGGEEPGDNDMTVFREFADLAVPELDERVINPTFGDDDTIEQRSADLQGPLEELLVSTGAPSVNIAAHSFGGLVARRYAWDHRGEVNSVAMISTPNGGQPLAGFLCPINAAMCQITEDYVREVFNKVVLDQEQVTYIARSSIKPGLEADDGIVSVESAEWLSRTDPDHPGKHFTRPRYAREHGELIAEGSPVFLDVLCEPSFYPLAEDCPIETSSLDGSGAAASSQMAVNTVEEVVVPAQGSLSVPLAFEGTAAAHILAVMDPAGASVAGTLSGAALDATEFFGISALEGRPTTPVDADLVLTNFGTEPVTAQVIVEIETARLLAAEVTPSLAAPQQPITVSASLGGWQVGDHLSATVVDALGTVVQIVELDDLGGGQYSAEIAGLLPGTYSVVTASSAPTRTDYTLLRVSSSAVGFAGGFTEELVGLGNGLADALVIRPAVDVSQAGRYAISARLVDSSGATVATAGTDVSLAVGTQTPELRFDGRAIFDSGRSGPYRLVDAVMATSNPLALEVEASDLGITQSHAFSDFEHFPVRFELDSFADQGVETNGDEIFESLDVMFSVSVEVGGSYALNARLLAPDGTQVAKTQSTPTLVSGTNELVLVFDHEAIATEGLDGPYEVADLSVYPLSNADHVGYLVSAHTTGPYTAEQFGAAPPQASVTQSFTFASGLAGWTGSGADCTSQHSNSDGIPAGSVSTTVSGKNRTATCTWSSPAGTWRDFGVPAGATVTSVRLESAASRVAACNDCLAGSIDGYRIRSGAGTLVAELWGGRPLPTGTEAWQTVASQSDQAVPLASQPAETEVQLSLAATLNTGKKGSSKVTLNQDEIVLVITYVATPCEAASPPTICAAVSLHGNHPIGADVVGVGHAAATASPVTVEYQIKEWSWDDCTTQTIQPWTAAIAADGAFDEAVEEFDFSYPVLPSATTDHYQVYIRAAAGGQSHTEYYELPVYPTQTSCFVAP